jgi:adenosylcobinamide-phosphate synthase
MFVMDISFLFDYLLILFLAFLIDLVFGELPDEIHPTLWMGKVIAYLKPKIKSENSMVEKINGVLLSIFVIVLFAVPVYFVIFLVHKFLGCYHIFLSRHFY